MSKPDESYVAEPDTLPEAINPPRLGDDPRDASFSHSQVSSLLTLRRACGTRDFETALFVAREAVSRERETVRLDEERRAKGVQRYIDQNVTSEAFRADLMSLDGLDEDVKARLVALRNRDVMAFCAELGRAREAAGK